MRFCGQAIIFNCFAAEQARLIGDHPDKDFLHYWVDVKSRWVEIISGRRFSVVVGWLEKEQLGNLMIFLSVIIRSNVFSATKSDWKVGFHFTLLQTCMEFGVVASFLIAILAFSSTTIFFFLLRYFSKPKYHIQKYRVLRYSP